MSYPISDKTKTKKIKDDFEILESQDYASTIETLRAVTINPTLKAKLEDKMFGKEHAFESMTCNHQNQSKLEKLKCTRCQFNKREIEAENLVNSLTGNEETIIQNPDGSTSTKPLKSLKIQRGNFDDVIGYVWEW